MMKSLPVLALLVVAAAVPSACSKDQPPPVAPTPSVDAGVWDGTDAGGAPWGAPSASAVPSASASVAPIPSGNPLDIATDAAIDLAIRTQSATAAPGMTPEGQAGRATLTEGEHFGMVVNLQPNQCYSILGFSPTGQIAQLEVKLLTPPLYSVQAGVSGANDKNQPVVGKGKAGALCPLLPIPVAYKIDVTAKKGVGRMGVQVFSRPK